MNKLTKEQAQMLKNLVFEKRKYRVDISNNSVAKEVFLFPIDVENIIDSLTEKRFPEFEISPYTKDEVEPDEFATLIKLTHSSDGACYLDPIEIECQDERGMRIFQLIPYEKFRRFTEGCIKIVKWLDEQEG